MSPGFLDETRDKWEAWCDRIGHDLLDLAVCTHLHREVIRIILANSALAGTASVYWFFMNVTYVDYAIAAIRRQLKDDPGGVSLVRLLRELSEHPGAIRREWFEARPPDWLGAYVRERAYEWSHAFFNEFAGSKAEHVDPTVVERDLADLRRALRDLEVAADRMVAHLGKKPPVAKPQHPELYGNVETLLSVFHRYRTLICRGPWDFNIPQSVGEEWRELFKQPWIRPDVGEGSVGAVEQAVSGLLASSEK